jgi:hypothetical protein
MKRLLSIGIVLLFIGMSIPSSLGNNMEYSYSTTKFDEDGINITINGTLGNNGWYISCVIITFSIGPNVGEVWYQINGEGWYKYTGYFYLEICEDGFYEFCVKYKDITGNISIECINFKIDQTPPSIALKKKIGCNKVEFLAHVHDETSGVNRVEFYLGNELQKNVTNPPYTWIYEGIINNQVTAIVYDNAGNFADKTFPHSPFYWGPIIYKSMNLSCHEYILNVDDYGIDFRFSYYIIGIGRHLVRWEYDYDVFCDNYTEHFKGTRGGYENIYMFRLIPPHIHLRAFQGIHNMFDLLDEGTMSVRLFIDEELIWYDTLFYNHWE